MSVTLKYNIYIKRFFGIKSIFNIKHKIVLPKNIQITCYYLGLGTIIEGVVQGSTPFARN